MIDQKEIDTIIIGSGAGGLAAAICLSRAGQKVLVLEQHDVPGGWCHSFYMNGHRFSPGVHYIGLLEDGESTNQLYRGLGIANDLTFFRMNPKAYEHCVIGDQRFDLPAGIDNLIDALAEKFPHERKNLTKYLRMVKLVSTELQMIPKMSGFWDNITIPWKTRHMGKYGLFSLKRVINWYIKDPVLQKILNVQCGDHGLAPARASFPLHCAVMDHYFSGGFYPMGGGGALVKSMTKALKKHGGSINTGTGVERILIEGDAKNRKAVGVELQNGEKLYAKRVISNADPTKTYLDLVGESFLSKKLNKRLNKTRYSCTSLILFLTVDMDVSKAGLDSGNIWLMSGRDMDDMYESMMGPDIMTGDEFEGMFISCTTLKDPTSYNGRYHSLEVVTFIHPDSFSQFKEESQIRSQAYLDFKEQLIEKMLKTVERTIPGIGEKIVQKHLGTPITNSHYINSTDGCVYGTEKTLDQIGPFAFQKKSEIENLYLCGASTLSHGVAGAGYSGVGTAATILGCKEADLVADVEGQELHIYDAQDSTNYPEWLERKIEVKHASVDRDVKRFSALADKV